MGGGEEGGATKAFGLGFLSTGGGNPGGGPNKPHVIGFHMANSTGSTSYRDGNDSAFGDLGGDNFGRADGGRIDQLRWRWRCGGGAGYVINGIL
jgi:hypothetical protein